MYHNILTIITTLYTVYLWLYWTDPWKRTLPWYKKPCTFDPGTGLCEWATRGHLCLSANTPAPLTVTYRHIAHQIGSSECGQRSHYWHKLTVQAGHRGKQKSRGDAALMGNSRFVFHTKATASKHWSKYIRKEEELMDGWRIWMERERAREMEEMFTNALLKRL